MPSSFDRVFVAWTTEIFVWEEPKVELPNWRMIGDGLCSSGAQRIGGLEFPCTSCSIFQFVLILF